MNEEHAPAGQDVEASEPTQDLKSLLLGPQARKLAMVVAVAVVASLAVSIYQARSRATDRRASDMLNVATSVRQLEEVIEQYPSTPATQSAILQLARAQYDAGSYEAARATYEQFEAKYEGHPMLPIARLGRIHCLEALGLTEEALEAFRGFAAADKTSYLRPVALMGMARCLKQLSRLEEAKATYEDLVVSHPESEWVPVAEEAIQDLKRSAERAAPPPAS